MNTAICFTGTGRSIKHTHFNLKQRLIGSFPGSDVFMLIAKNPDAHKISEYFGDLPQVKKIIIEEEEDKDVDSLRFRPNWPSGKLSSKQIYIKMIDSRKRCNEILSMYERQNQISYDRVIFSRLDVKYFEDVSKNIDNLDLKNLYVPDFHNTFGGAVNGYNDRFAISDRRNMDTYFRVPESIDNFMQSGGLIHAETLLKWHLNNYNINVKNLPIRFTRVRPDGTEMDLRIENRENWGWGDT